MKKLFISMLILPVLMTAAKAENDSKRMIIGKWKAVGSMCNEAGDCEKEETDEFYIELLEDGSTIMQDNGQVLDGVTWAIEDNKLVLSKNRGDKLYIKIFKLTEDTMMWQMDNGEIVRFAKEGTSGKQKEMSGDTRKNEYSEKIKGRWNLTGDSCSESGECESLLDGTEWIEFMDNGIARIGEGSSVVIDNISYSIDKNVITLTQQDNKKIILTILYMTQEDMLWSNQKQNRNQKLTRAANPGNRKVKP